VSATNFVDRKAMVHIGLSIHNAVGKNIAKIVNKIWWQIDGKNQTNFDICYTIDVFWHTMLYNWQINDRREPPF